MRSAPAVPVVLGHGVLEREDRIAPAQLLPPVHELLGAQRAPLDVVGAVAVELGHRRDRARCRRPAVPGVGGRGEDQLDRGLGRRDLGREPALVADGGAEAVAVQARLERVVDLAADAQGLGEARGAVRDDHELLQVERVVGVRAAVDDVHHRHGQDMRGRPAERAPERQAEGGGRGLGDRQRGAEHAIGADAALVGRPVDLAQQPVDAALVVHVVPEQRRGELVVDARDRAFDRLAAVGGAAVTALDGLVRARSRRPRARRRGRARRRR